MKKILVAYFSCTGTTRRVAERLENAVGANLYEIKPAAPYTAADLDWTDASSRSSVEMKDRASRPEIAGGVENMSDYDAVFVGFPIWWYVAPHIVNAFLERYDFSGKTVVPFATSGGSGMGGTEAVLKECCASSTVWGKGRVFKVGVSENELADWAKKSV